jgi:putative ABC transport system permease protein
MKHLSLVWRNLFRKKTRTFFTFMTIFVSFLLFAFLMATRAAFSMGVEIASAERLMLMHKVSLLQLLPISYEQQIQSTPGVALVTHNTWFGGTYQDKPTQYGVIAVEPEKLLQVYPEIKVKPEELKNWLADRQGVMVGRDTATRMNWKVGDRVPIKGTIWLPKQGDTWFFNISAIYDADKNFDKTGFYFRYDYLDENRRGAYGQVGWYVVKIKDPNQAAQVSAAIDQQFANSAAETKTSPEKAWMQGFANQIGNIGYMLVLILTAVLFVMLIVAANTMTQAVRERTMELAVLKTLGFSNTLVLTMVLLESVVLAVVGGGLGLLAGAGMVNLAGGFASAFLPIFSISTNDLILGGVLCIVLGLLSGALPAMSAMNLRITDALRRN